MNPTIFGVKYESYYFGVKGQGFLIRFLQKYYTSLPHLLTATCGVCRSLHVQSAYVLAPDLARRDTLRRKRPREKDSSCSF